MLEYRAHWKWSPGNSCPRPQMGPMQTQGSATKQPVAGRKWANRLLPSMTRLWGTLLPSLPITKQWLPEGQHHQMQMTRQQVLLFIHSRSGCCYGQTWHLALSSHCRCNDVFTKEQFLPGVGRGQENGDLLLRWHLNFACYRQEHHFVCF